ncbi:hypothetical protein CAEBREN_18547 [Caenorhabditis brenneri]|uniref:Domain of unknown function WSN domain-containing protein n=1 Tax=Caenorhabditis brenneri TaxID=135651 RepID=G0PI07_CAEBE|nr:hypothetical protein CAEBREN_18547 [Caenorhabditis brenneri]
MRGILKSRILLIVLVVVISDDAFTTLHSRITTLARVVTGVTLYNGLQDISITHDDAIAELMNVGSINFLSLDYLNRTKVNDFVKKVVEVAEKLKPETEKFEKSLMDISKVKDMWNFGHEMSKIPNATKFAELTVMETIDLRIIEEFDLDDAYRKLSANSAPDIPNIKTMLTNVADASKNARAFMDHKYVLPLLYELEPFHKFVQYQFGKLRVFCTESDIFISVSDDFYRSCVHFWFNQWISRSRTTSKRC